MTNITRKVVLFPHPGKEHKASKNQIECGNKLIMPWNCSEHKRKFLLSKGSYVDSNSNLHQNETIAFWGEWEQPSEFIELNNTNSPCFIHTPICPENDVTKHLKTNNKIDSAFMQKYRQNNSFYNGKQNTDPYVFGDRFYYSCCKQSISMMKNLDPGDVVIFYSTTGKGVLKAYVDTVFVIGGRIEINGQREYSYADIDNLNELMSKCTIQYFTGAILPIVFGNKGSLPKYTQNTIKNVLYYGATFDNPIYVNGEKMYSFFPCKRITSKDMQCLANYQGFERPLVFERPLISGATSNYDEKYGTILNKIRCKDSLPNTGVVGKDVLNGNSLNDVYAYWKNLKDYFLENGYLIGVKALEPEIQLYECIDKHSKKQL